MDRITAEELLRSSKEATQSALEFHRTDPAASHCYAQQAETLLVGAAIVQRLDAREPEKPPRWIELTKVHPLSAGVCKLNPDDIEQIGEANGKVFVHHRKTGGYEVSQTVEEVEALRLGEE